MNIHISFKNIDPSESLKTFIQEKSSTLPRYFNGILHINWTLSINKQEKTAHCHVIGNGVDYFSESESNDFKSSVDSTLEKIKTQLRKHKDIIKNHHP